MFASTTRIANQGGMLIAGACLQWAALAAEAAEPASRVWRCGNAYSDRACQHGSPLDVDDTRSAEQQRAASQSTRDARASAEQMERDRQRLEAKAGQAIVLDDRALRPRQSETAVKNTEAQRLKPRKDPQFVTPGEPPVKKRKKKSSAD